MRPIYTFIPFYFDRAKRKNEASNDHLKPVIKISTSQKHTDSATK